MIRISLTLCGAAMLAGAMLPGTRAVAGPFDCSVVYDEADSFMNRQFFVRPGAYTRVQSGAISRAEVAQQQIGKLRLNPAHAGYAVAVAKTNGGHWGKFFFVWDTGPGDLRGTPLLILREITLYTDPQAGTGARSVREVRMTSSQTVDLDTGRVTTSDAADIAYTVGSDGALKVEAVNGATLSFPLETMCRN